LKKKQIIYRNPNIIRNIQNVTNKVANINKVQQQVNSSNNVHNNPVNSMSDLRDVVFVAYYTINTPYEQEAAKLIKSLEKLNIRYDVVGVPNLGNWQANTRFKAKFMLDMLDKHIGSKLVYVDSDAIVHKRPELFSNYNCDVAVRWQDFRWRKNECLSGTIYMDNNQRTRELCRRWLQINDSEGPNAKTFEQWNLGTVIKEMEGQGKLTTKNLPPEYTFIFDSMRQIYPNTVPVIEHFQASRRLKNKITSNTNTNTNTNINGIITNELYINNEIYYNSLNVREKRVFLEKLQLESVRRFNLRDTSKKTINMVLFGHWGWVFSKILSKFVEYSNNYNIIYSVYPLNNSDVYVYWRNTNSAAKDFFKKQNINSLYYKKGIMYLHDSPNDNFRFDSEYKSKIFKYFNNIHCTSIEQYNYVKKYTNKLYYNPLGVNSEFKTKSNINLNRPINIGFVGRSYGDGVKNEKNLLNIARVLNNKEYCFTILSNNIKHISDNIKSLGYKVYTNNDGDLHSLYSNIDVLLILSKYEGTPLPLIESLKLGHTILSTPVGESSTYLDNFYIMRSIDDFVEKIKLINNNREILQTNLKNNPIKVLNNTWENHIKKCIEIWEKI
jgi:glycosyltransferase involved in cell wall biosynthesis